MYLVYFSVFILTLIITILIYFLYYKGHRIMYENNDLNSFKVRNGVRNLRRKITNSNRFSNYSNFEPTYISLKRDFPEFDIDQMKDDIKKYILSVLKDELVFPMTKTSDFDSNLEILITNQEIDIQSLRILQTIMEKYYKDDDLIKIKFNTTIEYDRNYVNGIPRKIRENYVSEFVHSLIDFQKNRKVKCPNCGNDVIVIQKNTKCSKCNIDIDSDIWYFKNIEKR